MCQNKGRGNREVKRLLIYLATAVVLGFLAIMAPLITFAAFRHEELTATSPWLRANFRGLEGYDNLATSNADVPGFTVLTVSFVIAMIAYLLVRRRIPKHDIPWIRIPPY
jgi:hypothetical protein